MANGKPGRPLKLQTYLGRQISNGATSVVLYRTQTNGALGAKIENFKLESNTDGEALTEVVLSVAQGDADSLNQRQGYTLRALCGGEILGNYALTVSPETDDGEAPATEQPSVSGLIAQLMRHNESVMRTNHALTSEIATMGARQAEMFTGIIDTLSKGYQQGLEARGELATRESETDIAMQLKLAELEIQKSAQDRKDKLLHDGLGMLAPLIPGMMGKLLEAGVMPAKGEADGDKSGN